MNDESNESKSNKGKSNESSEVRDIYALQCQIGNQSQECAAVTCATIPILPLRYSAHPCPPSLPSYSYQNEKNLLPKSGFPSLLRMQYDLRHVGGGLIYLFNESNGKISLWQANEDGTFSALVSGHCSLGSKLEDYKFGDKKSWLWVEKDSLVHIVLTD
ncbi:MAG: hypothetical protein LBC37_05605, partial [Zoogloeaceae bacterium]|nr:hypothetical protein [Zoogloeaceae bacterium]